MTFPVSITPRRIVSFYDSSTFMLWGRLAKFLRFSTVPSASNFWGSLAECFFYKWWLSTTLLFEQPMIQHQGVLATDNSATATDDSRKTMTWERHHAALPVCPQCLETSYTLVLVLSIGFPSLKPSPQLARLFVSVWWCLGCPCSNFSCCRSNRWCRSCCKRHRVFSLPQMYPTTLRLKTGLSRNMTKILTKGSQKKKIGRSFSHRWGYTNKYMNGLTDSYFLLFSKFAVTTGPRLKRNGNSRNMRTLK